jgi:L-lactate utilization protein LutC
MSTRDVMLQRVRTAMAEGNRLAEVLPLPERGAVGYQGGGVDPLQRFCDELTAAGGMPHVVDNPRAARELAVELATGHGVRRALLSRCELIDRLDVAGALRVAGIAVDFVDEPGSAQESRDVYFGADIGMSGVYRLIAETGTVVMATSPQQPRSVSLLPPLHIAFAEPSQILPDLFDLFDLFAPGAAVPPSCLTLITGPSKTGDIELRLVTGVHGPGEIHVIVCDGANRVP